VGKLERGMAKKSGGRGVVGTASSPVFGGRGKRGGPKGGKEAYCERG